MAEPLPPLQDQIDHLKRQVADLDRRLTEVQQQVALGRGFLGWLFGR